MLLSEKKRTLSNHLAILFFILILPLPLFAQMLEVCDEELSDVSAQAGINWRVGNSGVRVNYDSVQIKDTDNGNWIEFNGITVGDGAGGFFSIDTPDDNDATNTLDVGTLPTGNTILFMNLSDHVEPRTYNIESIVFRTQETVQDLGSLRLENVRKDSNDRLSLSGRSDGQCGIDFEYHTKIDIDSIKYTYNTTPTSLELKGIHLSQFAGGSPEDPTSWTFLGKFMIGDVQAGTPATMDVATGDLGGGVMKTAIMYNFPMKGSARVEEVNFGGNNFGPCAIDGINVHHLYVVMPGN